MEYGKGRAEVNMKKAKEGLSELNLVGLKPSRMFRYKIMEHEENTYVVDMLPHWYSVFWGFILNFIPSRFYQVENPSKLYYKSTWKGNGGSIGIIMGVTVFSSLVARIISQRIGGFDIKKSHTKTEKQL